MKAQFKEFFLVLVSNMAINDPLNFTSFKYLCIGFNNTNELI